ncbi:hypothetical protein ACFP56_07965 [Paenibacillus septentrionalis]|uniref:DUF2325 domain-containing protein n=1 Tax=Paenibacillus septentrionalis TaxID=429342 RepID=A0ABW1V538_9BACL
MKLHSAAGAGYNDTLTESNAAAYRNGIELHVNRAFPQNSLMQYVRTLSNYDKLMLAITLKLPFTRRDLKQWPELLFYKKLNLIIKKIATDRKLKKQLLLYLIDRTIADPPSLETIKNHLPQLTAEYGYWAIYWTLYFHYERQEQEELYQSILKELEALQESSSVQDTAGIQETAAAASELVELNEADTKQEQLKLEKKIAILEDKISKEIATRQQLELTNVQKDKTIRQLQQEQEKLQQHASLLKEQIAMYEMKISNLERIQQESAYRRKEDEERWLQERASLLGQNKTNLDDIRKLHQQLEQIQRELDDSKRQTSNWQQLAQQRQEELHTLANSKAPLEQQLNELSEQMHNQLDTYNHDLLHLLKHDEASYEQRLYYRQQMLNMLQIVDAIDKFKHAEQQHNRDEQDNEPPIAAEQLFTAEELKSVAATEKKETQRFGTFYRRDHGGYIELENGEIFNITESLVQQLELQHEAEVLCTPTAHPGRANHYTIELLFQGDDSFSPVHTYDGFVLFDEDQKWYCVDLNDESNRFPIHYKDIEIQKPGHGDPCTFNVAEDGHIARLTKLYRVHGEMTESHPGRKKNETRTKTTVRRKIEPFLEDCTVTIIGGQRKWFESVVKETGAALVHDGGEHPERIASELSRSQALFMILTSTSHRATWEGIEIAKSNQIPHFIIQGSKSNLRKLLWDNQEIIRTSNRAVEA